MANSEYLEHPIFLCGHRKTGTTLLLSLLDHHPQLAVYPSDSSFFYAYFPNWQASHTGNTERINRMIETVIAGVEVDTANWKDDFDQPLNFPFDDLKSRFRELAGDTDTSPKQMLLSIIQAFREVWLTDHSPTAWVEKTTSSEIYASEMLEWFPNARFIHIVRDPRDNWASLRSGWEKRYQNFNDSPDRLMSSMLSRGRTGMLFADLNTQLIGDDRYIVIRYEDLTTDPTGVIVSLSSKLGIDNCDILHQPTFCGRTWRGNNFDGQKFEGVSGVNAGRWRQRIPESEAALIEFHFADLMQRFDYPLETSAATQATAAIEHYKWFNFAQVFSYTDHI